MALSTAGQLAVVALLLAWLGPRLGEHRAIAASEPRSERDLGSGEPTPVWRLPLIVVLAGAAGLVAGWDAGVRVTGGCALVGLAEVLVLERIVAADEDETGRRIVANPGPQTPLGEAAVAEHGRARPLPATARAAASRWSMRSAVGWDRRSTSRSISSRSTSRCTTSASTAAPSTRPSASAVRRRTT